MTDANAQQQQPQQPVNAQQQQAAAAVNSLGGIDQASVAAITQAIVMAIQQQQQQQQPVAAPAQVAVPQAVALALSSGQAKQQQQQPVAAPAQVAVPQAVAFALSSGQATVGLIDFQSKAGRNIENKCLRGTDTKFDGTASQLESFRQNYLKHAADMDLRKTIHGPIPQSNGSVLNVLDHAPQLSEKQLRDAADPYMSGKDQHSRSAQDNKLSVDYLMASLTDPFKLTILSNKGIYTYAVPDPNNSGVEKTTECAALLFKAIMDIATLDCAASLRKARTRLEASRSIMKSECGGEKVVMYNKLFEQTYCDVLQRGGSYDDEDLGYHYMNGLASTSCEAFNDAVQARLVQWQDQDHYLPIGPQGQMIHCDYATLKSIGQKNYNLLKQTGKWTSISNDDQIIALSAQITALKADLSRE